MKKNKYVYISLLCICVLLTAGCGKEEIRDLETSNVAEVNSEAENISDSDDKEESTSESVSESKDPESSEEVPETIDEATWKSIYAEVVRDWHNKYSGDLYYGYNFYYINDDAVPELLALHTDELDMEVFSLFSIEGDKAVEIANTYMNFYGIEYTFYDHSGWYFARGGMADGFDVSGYCYDPKTQKYEEKLTMSGNADEFMTDEYGCYLKAEGLDGSIIEISHPDDCYFSWEGFPEKEDIAKALGIDLSAEPVTMGYDMLGDAQTFAFLDMEDEVPAYPMNSDVYSKLLNGFIDGDGWFCVPMEALEYSLIPEGFEFALKDVNHDNQDEVIVRIKDTTSYNLIAPADSWAEADQGMFSFYDEDSGMYATSDGDMGIWSDYYILQNNKSEFMFRYEYLDGDALTEDGEWITVSEYKYVDKDGNATTISENDFYSQPAYSWAPLEVEWYPLDKATVRTVFGEN